MQQLSSESGSVILAGDVAIGRNPHEVIAWKAAGHTISFLKAGWTNIEFWQQVQEFARCFQTSLVGLVEQSRATHSSKRRTASSADAARWSRERPFACRNSSVRRQSSRAIAHLSRFFRLRPGEKGRSFQPFCFRRVSMRFLRVCHSASPDMYECRFIR